MRVEIEQGTQPWLDLRQKHPRTASRTPIVQGLSPWQTIGDLWGEFHGQKKEATFAMNRGTRLEPKARSYAEAELGLIFTPSVYVDGDYLASLDGDDGKHILELKVPMKGKDSATWLLAAKGHIEPHYQAQIQHQLAVSGMKKAYFVVFDGVSDVVVVEQYPQADAWAEIQAAWDVAMPLLLADEKPVTEDDYTVIESVDWADAASSYREYKMLADRFEAEAKAQKDRLVAMATADRCKGNGVRFNRSARAGSVDYAKAIKVLAPDADLSGFKKADSVVNTINLI